MKRTVHPVSAVSWLASGTSVLITAVGVLPGAVSVTGQTVTALGCNRWSRTRRATLRSPMPLKVHVGVMLVTPEGRKPMASS